MLVLAFGLFGWRMHSRGCDAATAHDKAVVAACVAANASQARTIGNLHAANQEWAETKPLRFTAAQWGEVGIE